MFLLLFSVLCFRCFRIYWLILTYSFTRSSHNYRVPILDMAWRPHCDHLVAIATDSSSHLSVVDATTGRAVSTTRRRKLKSDALATAWVDRNTIMFGHRNGVVQLYDTRCVFESQHDIPQCSVDGKTIAPSQNAGICHLLPLTDQRRVVASCVKDMLAGKT